MIILLASGFQADTFLAHISCQSMVTHGLLRCAKGPDLFDAPADGRDGE
jgi:hypothetical protein